MGCAIHASPHRTVAVAGDGLREGHWELGLLRQFTGEVRLFPGATELVILGCLSDVGHERASREDLALEPRATVMAVCRCSC